MKTFRRCKTEFHILRKLEIPTVLTVAPLFFLLHAFKLVHRELLISDAHCFKNQFIMVYWR
jgi:hypothetical protein